jgi:hypothetical protein
MQAMVSYAVGRFKLNIRRDEVKFASGRQEDGEDGQVSDLAKRSSEFRETGPRLANDLIS